MTRNAKVLRAMSDDSDHVFIVAGFDATDDLRWRPSDPGNLPDLFLCAGGLLCHARIMRDHAVNSDSFRVAAAHAASVADLTSGYVRRLLPYVGLGDKWGQRCIEQS
jgi:hypothetical protein